MANGEGEADNPQADKEADKRTGNQGVDELQMNDCHHDNRSRCHYTEEDDKHDRCRSTFHRDAIVAELLVLLIVMVIRSLDKFTVCCHIYPHYFACLFVMQIRL